jgi:hypothetical protein
MEAVQIRLLFVDDDRSAIMVNISVMITLLNDDGFVVAIPMIPVSDDVTVAVPVTISVTLTNRYASTANTNPDFLRSSRHCAANANHGGDYYGILNHCVLLSLLNPGMAMSQRRDRSGFSPAAGWNKRRSAGWCAYAQYSALLQSGWSSGGPAELYHSKKVSGQYCSHAEI